MKEEDKSSKTDITDSSLNLSYDNSALYDASGEKIVTRQYQQISIGPLPPGDEIIKYNSVIPNGADRIMAMAEKEQQARINRDKNSYNLKRLGQIFAFISVIALITLGSIFTFTGHEGLGYVMFGSLGGVALAAVFLGQFIKSNDKH